MGKNGNENRISRESFVACATLMDCCSAQKERIKQYDDAIAHTHTHAQSDTHVLTHTCPHIKQLNGIAFHRKVKQNQNEEEGGRGN